MSWTNDTDYPVLIRGYKIRNGKQVWRTVTVRDASGKIIHQTTYYSNYSRVDGITLVGKSAATN